MAVFELRFVALVRVVDALRTTGAWHIASPGAPRLVKTKINPWVESRFKSNCKVHFDSVSEGKDKNQPRPLRSEMTGRAKEAGSDNLFFCASIWSTSPDPFHPLQLTPGQQLELRVRHGARMWDEPHPAMVHWVVLRVPPAPADGSTGSWGGLCKMPSGDFYATVLKWVNLGTRSWWRLSGAHLNALPACSVDAAES